MKTKKTTPPVRISTNRSLAHQRSLLVLFMLACLALLPIARGQDGAVGPAANGNTAEGTNALHSLSGKATGKNNTAMGFDALLSNTDGVANTATGSGALQHNTTGSDNTAIGFSSLYNNTTTNQNTAVGSQALYNNKSGAADAFGDPPPGQQNTAVGYQALYNNTSGPADANGNTGGEQNTAVGYQALFGNTTGWPNTALGYQALSNNTIGVGNTALGYQALSNNIMGSGNIAVGDQALFGNTNGIRSVAVGGSTLLQNSNGDSNTAVGNASLGNGLTGSFNTAIGRRALSRTNSNINIGLGYDGGCLLRTGDNNIDIGNVGVASDANTIRIGQQVATTDPSPSAGIGTLPAHTATFIAGIYGATTSDTVNTAPVVIDINGNLGTAASSERFKRDVKPMDKSSEGLLALKPVTFHYKSDTKDTPQFGLVAEEVAKVNPNLVVRDGKGDIYTVRYDAVNAMLLNEFLKEHRTVQEQQKQIATLAAQLKEQAALIQKVSAQVELNKPSPQIAVNSP